MTRDNRVCAALAAALAMLAWTLVSVPSASAVASQPDGNPPLSAASSLAVQHDVSPPLRSMATSASSSTGAAPSTSSAFTTTASVNFDGLAAGAGGASNLVIPPDPSGDIGPNDYVEVVNTAFAVFTKTGSVRYGPVSTKTLWSGFSNGCANTDDGLAVVRYDSLADRWIISVASVSQSSSAVPYLECVAVSATADPTGAYNRYAFAYPSYPAYAKLSVWSDAYYVTFEAYSDSNGSTYRGPEVCALNRSAMLQALAADQQCALLGTQYQGVLAADLDGPAPPPAGEAEPLLALNSLTTLASWQMHVDWANSANTTITGPTTISVPAFEPVCRGTNYAPCISQPGTSQRLSGGGDRLMDRLAYRNFGDHESLLVNHSVQTGIRWYELRSPAAPSVYQQGTYAPDSTSRWMGSVAQDQAGDIGLGFSASSSTLFPQISYTARRATAPLGVMSEPETTPQAGFGSQTSTSSVPYWGRNSAMSVDPSDGCTFWYVNEYLGTTGSYNWHTRIGTFKLPYCATTVVLTSGANPSTARQPLTLTAQVTSGGPTATGTMSFLDGTTVLGSAPLSSGAATFTTSALTAGIHNLSARYDGDVDHAAAVSPALSQRMDFTDVPPGSTFYDDITWFAGRKITTGFPDSSFRPADGVTRQAFAAYLYRYVYYGVDAGPCPVGTSTFNDVPDSSQFCGDIKALADAGVASGFPDGGFHPTAFVTRQAAAAFLYRFNHLGISGDAGPCAAGTSAFTDVPDTNPFCGDIKWMASTTPKPITSGFADGGFHPSVTVTRQAAAAFFHRYNADFPSGPGG